MCNFTVFLDLAQIFFADFGIKAKNICDTQKSFLAFLETVSPIGLLTSPNPVESSLSWPYLPGLGGAEKKTTRYGDKRKEKRPQNQDAQELPRDGDTKILFGN